MVANVWAEVAAASSRNTDYQSVRPAELHSAAAAKGGEVVLLP